MALRPELANLRRSFALLGLCALAGCSSAPPPMQRLAHHRSQIDPRYGVAPSPRVVADGEPVPRGGGSYMVGKPYQIAGKTYYPSERPYSSVGLASWYGSDFHGRKTANGEVFDRESISAAHPTIPLPSYARVTNLRNHRSMIVRVNDRGPYHGGRVMDVSQRVAEALDFHRVGTARVKVDYVGRASLAGSDDEKLLATLREDGRPAQLPGVAPVMVASRPEPVRTAMLEAPAPRPERAAPRPAEPEEAASSAAPVSARAIAMAKSAPLPPSRPFDLGASRGRARTALD
jgi:rare lipoprotein A